MGWTTSAVYSAIVLSSASACSSHKRRFIWRYILAAMEGCSLPSCRLPLRR